MIVSSTLAGPQLFTGYLNRCFVIESMEGAQAVDFAKRLREQVSGGGMRMGCSGLYFVGEMKRRLELAF